MLDKKLIQLEKIKYKNEDYQVFADSTGRRIFFKIEKDNIYTYPEIKIYLELDQIYNHKNITVVYSKKDIKRKLIEGTLIVANITLLSLNVYNLVKDDLIENKIIQSNYQTYNKIGYNTAINLAYQSEDVFQILNDNKNIEEKAKEYIKKFIINLKKEKPTLDLSIFKTNLKDLKIIEMNDKEFKIEHGENVSACFSSMEKTIFYSDKYDLEKTIYHELGHLINVIYFEDRNLLYHIEGENGFGESLNEGFNSVFTNSLIGMKDNAYNREQSYIKILKEVIGSQKLEECYLGGSDIVEALSEYDQVDEIKRTIMLMDDLCTISSNKDIDSKETSLEIAKKLLEWSRTSAKNKYNELKNQNVNDSDLEQAYFYQLLNTDILLSQAFGFDRPKIKELERSIQDNSDIFKKYDTLLNDDENYLERLKEQLNFISNKRYFMVGVEQLTFEQIENNLENYEQHKSTFN